MSHSRKQFWIIGGGLVVACLVLVSSAVAWTSRTAFCVSCHEMRVHQAELALSAHARDANNQEIACSSCHIPSANLVRMLAAKSWLGIRDVWVHNFGNPNDLDRREMQVVARRFTDDANCRACHIDLMRNAKNDGSNSLEGQLSHANYLGENGQSRSGCVGCHINIAHLPAFDQRIPVNQKFALKLKESRS